MSQPARRWVSVCLTHHIVNYIYLQILIAIKQANYENITQVTFRCRLMLSKSYLWTLYRVPYNLKFRAARQPSKACLDPPLLPCAARRDVNTDISTPLLHPAPPGSLQWTVNQEEYPPSEPSGLSKPSTRAYSYARENSSIIRTTIMCIYR